VKQFDDLELQEIDHSEVVCPPPAVGVLLEQGQEEEFGQQQEQLSAGEGERQQEVC